MAFRRFTRRPFNAGRRSSFRFRRRLSTVHRPIRWSRANFHIRFLHFHDIDNRGVLTVVPLAQLNPLVPGLGGNPSQAIRKITVGGIKFTITRRFMGFTADPSATLNPVNDWRDTNLRNISTKVLLCSDRLVGEPVAGGVTPQALNTNWFTNTYPIAATSEIQDEEILFPTRIHWQDYKEMDASLDQIQEIPGESLNPHVYTKAQQAVVNPYASANLKLRLRLQDDECLVFHFASFADNVLTSENLEPEVAFTASGTLWYRVGW